MGWCWWHYWCSWYWSDYSAVDIPGWLTGIGTIFLALVTAFQDRIRAVFWRPRLSVSIRLGAPDCLSTVVSPPGIRAFYARIWVENKGNASAADVEVSGVALRSAIGDDWERVAGFPPMNFVWADTESPEQARSRVYWPRIAPGMGKHCDLVVILNPEDLKRALELQPWQPWPGSVYRASHLNLNGPTMRFVLAAQPNHGLNIVGPGRYRIDLAIAARDLDPIRRTVELSLSKQWHDDHAQMLSVRIL